MNLSSCNWLNHHAMRGLGEKMTVFLSREQRVGSRRQLAAVLTHLYIYQNFPMAKNLAEKLRIKEGMKLLTINAPGNFSGKIDGLPKQVSASANEKEYQQVHWFVRNKAQVEKEISRVLKLVRPGVLCWIYYPKVSSKVQTDLTRDNGWEALLKHDEMQWVSLISFDDTWSAFGMRLKNEADKKKAVAPKVREIFNWVNPATKEVKLPGDLSSALKKNKKEQEYFNSLSFTNKKEYIEWIVTAKKEETRTERINGTIERLGKQWKNPGNR
jgi:hypothetical protein